MYSLQFIVWKVTLEVARGECQQVTKFIMKYICGPVFSGCFKIAVKVNLIVILQTNFVKWTYFILNL